MTKSFISTIINTYINTYTISHKSSTQLTHINQTHKARQSDDGLRGLSVVAHELLLIDIGELVKLNICIGIEGDWAWVALGSERQPYAAAGAPGAVKDAPVVDEGAQVDPIPVQAPQPPPPPPAMAGRLIRNLMGHFEGVTQRPSRGVPNAGPIVPAPPQLLSSQTHDLSIPHLLTKTSSKFSTIVREYVMEPSMLSKSKAELRRESI
ncbi:hypothetical protein Tco_1343840 [Tanacetum coccineum]